MPVPTVMKVPARTVRHSDMLLLDDDGNNTEDGQPREWRLPPEINHKVWLKTEDTFSRGRFIFPFELWEEVWILRPVPTDEEKAQAENERVLNLRQKAADRHAQAERYFLETATESGAIRAMNRYGDQVREAAATEALWQIFDRALEDGVQRGEDGNPTEVPHTPATALQETLRAVQQRLVDGNGRPLGRSADEYLIDVRAMQNFIRHEGRR